MLFFCEAIITAFCDSAHSKPTWRLLCPCYFILTIRMSSNYIIYLPNLKHRPPPNANCHSVLYPGTATGPQ